MIEIRALSPGRLNGFEGTGQVWKAPPTCPLLKILSQQKLELVQKARATSGAEPTRAHETKKRDFLHREFRYGAIERLMPLPQGVKAEDIKASFSNGLLQLTIPMPEETTPKEVKVHVEHAESKPADGKKA